MIDGPHQVSITFLSIGIAWFGHPLGDDFIDAVTVKIYHLESPLSPINLIGCMR